MNIQLAIMMRAAYDPSSLLTLKRAAEEVGLRVSCFTRDMRDSTNDRKVQIAQAAKEAKEIEFLGVLVFGPKSAVEKLTKEFPLIA